MKHLIAAFAFFAASTAQAACVPYGPASLTGTVVRQTYAGPPDYESVTKGDQPIVIYLLQLDPTLCVIESRVVGQGTREIQLQWALGGPERFRDFLGRKVTVNGELVRGGAQHDKRVVLVASGIVQ
jgi:hypothetical protein